MNECREVISRNGSAQGERLNHFHILLNLHRPRRICRFIRRVRAGLDICPSKTSLTGAVEMQPGLLTPVSSERIFDHGRPSAAQLSGRCVGVRADFAGTGFGAIGFRKGALDALFR